MAAEIVVRATGDFRRLYAELDRGESRFGAFGSKAKAAIAGAALAGGAALIKFGADSVGAASDAQQSIGATETVFGRFADTVIKRSRAAADAVGLSANEYRELANVTGATLRNAGTPLKEVTDLTARLTKRAADLAATYGGTTKEAIEAVSSLLRGEADPIERYGVSIKQSDVNAQLAAKGLSKLTGAALKQAEQQARLDLLFQQTSKSAGQFAREGDTLAGKQQRLSAKIQDVEAKFGDLLIPALAAAADWAGDELVPALDDLAGWLGENSDEFASLGAAIKDAVLPPLKAGVDLAQTAVDIFGDLPAPVKEFGVQAAVAALVLPRLSSGVSMLSSSAQTLVGNLDSAEKAGAAFGRSLRTLAGVGGMLALVQGVQETNGSLKTLELGLGGAATGLYVGGPWGAAVGGATGLVLGLAQANRDAREATLRAAGAAGDSATTWDSYRQTLDNVTGATTRATKAMVIQDLQQSGLLKTAGTLGISQQTLVNGILGRTKASAALSDALKKEEADLIATGLAYREKYDTVAKRQSEDAKAEFAVIEARWKNIDAIKAEVGEIDKATQARAEEIAVMKNIPPAIVTEIQTPGAVKSAQDIAKLAVLYGLTPKQVSTIIKMSGVDTTRSEVQKLRGDLVGVGNVKPGTGWRKQFGQDLAGAAGNARQRAADMNALLGTVGDKKPNVARGPFGRGLGADLNTLMGTARTKGNGVGNNLGSGMYLGLGIWIGPIRDRAAAMVHGAVSAANAAGAVRSPSRKTMYTGEMLGTGLERGIDRMVPRVTKAGHRAGAAALAGIAKGVTDGSSGIDKALGGITKLIQQRITGKKQGQRENALLRRLRDEYAALRANGKAQDRLNERLDAARDKLREAVDAYKDYARSIRDAVQATGDLTQFGKQDDGSVSLTALLDQAASATARAERFNILMQQLAKNGLSQDQIDRMLAAGPDAALATAEAIATGGKSAIAELNAYQKRLNAASDQLSKAMADRYYKTGVDAAQGIVKGLESEAAKLDKAAVRLANELVKAVKKALGIKSPSRVFRGIANNVTDGLTYQLDANSTYVKRSGAVLASSLVKGFADPQLDASVLSTSAAASQRLEVRLSADAVDQLSRGRQLQRDLDYARSNGVLGTTF